jgi:threonyl-tRNA synthetase
VSRELYVEPDNLGEIAKLVKSQQEVLLDLFQEHKTEVDTKLQSKVRKFGSKQIEKQYEINAGFLETAQKALTCVEEKNIIRAKALLENLVQQLQEHEEDLLIADASPHGWLAVAKLRTTKELPKSLRKRLAEVDRQLSSQKDGKFKKKPAGFPGQGQEPIFKRADRRISPEEALFSASKQVRPGSYSHCHKGLHYYRECPEFWKKVQESREAKAKESQSKGGN